MGPCTAINWVNGPRSIPAADCVGFIAGMRPSEGRIVATPQQKAG